MKTRDKRASEKELVARPSSNKDVSLKNQKRAELLRSRIEELDRRLAILNSEREKSAFREAARRGSSHGRQPLFKFTYVVATLTAISGWLWLLSNSSWDSRGPSHCLNRHG